MISFIGRILNVAKDYKARLYVAAICSFIKAVLSKAPIVVSFLLIKEFVDGSITGASCLYAGFLMIASIILQCIFQNISDRLQSGAGFEIFADMRLALGEHLRKMPMGFFTEGNIGRISSVLSTDMNFIEENLMMLLADIMSYLFSAIIFVIFMFFFNYKLGLISLLITLIVFSIGEAMKNGTLAHSEERQAASQKLTESVIDFTEGIGIIKTYNMLGEKSKELTNSFRESCEKSIKFENDFSPWSFALNATCGLGGAVMLAMTCFLYVNGELSLVYLIGMLLFVFELFGPLKAFYGQVTRLTVMSACLDRIEAIFDEEELKDEGVGLLPDEGDLPEVGFEDVTFAYNKEDVLKNISFEINAHTMTALVGPSGSGKSTIASLLARFWDIKEGHILIRGQDIRNIPLAELMNHISMVFQRVYLFQDTVYNNIAMGRLDATKEEVYDAAKKARCYDFIMNLPEGFDTVIGEGGASLSGGEKQRISIARCILKDAPIVILDEATASVDADNEVYIQKAISELVKGKTLLVIAHRLNTIAKANQILVVDDGQIVERGTHTELIEANGIYSKMVQKRTSMKSFLG